jgi:hypothetical protein
MTESEHKNEKSDKLGILLGNAGKPIRLSGMQLDGISAEAGRAGESIKIWTRLCLTSDDRFFHRVAESLNSHIEFMARQSGHVVNLKNAGYVLLVAHPDNTGELWVDAAAVALLIMPKRDMVAGSVLFNNDIADVTGMSFPRVDIDEKDRIVCIFREGWRFGLFFDANPDGQLGIPEMQRDLGTLYRRLAHRDLYDAIADQATFSRLLAAGWFPFVEILGAEFQSLAKPSEAGFELGDEEAKLLAKFDTERLERMFKRWMVKPHFAGKEPLLRSAINSFTSGDAVPVLKIVLTEIEGILNEAYRKIHGQSAKIKVLLAFAVSSAEAKAGRPDTLLFPTAFAEYLQQHTFANFDPSTSCGSAGSRHAVGHGHAAVETYTLVRALQALLTLDQLAFYT